MKLFKFRKKRSKQHNYISDFRRQARNRRYYLRHREELKARRREYYSINGK